MKTHENKCFRPKAVLDPVLRKHEHEHEHEHGSLLPMRWRPRAKWSCWTPTRTTVTRAPRRTVRRPSLATTIAGYRAVPFVSPECGLGSLEPSNWSTRGDKRDVGQSPPAQRCRLLADCQSDRCCAASCAPALNVPDLCVLTPSPLRPFRAGLTDILEPQEKAVTGCQHTFCRSCLGEWLRVRRFCPLCKVRGL